MLRSNASAFALPLFASLLLPAASRGGYVRVADDPPGGGAGRLAIDPQETFAAEGAIMTNLPALFGGLNVNNFLGADRFYSAGITGQGTTVTVVDAGHAWNGHVTLPHVTNFTTGTGALGETDRHATSVASVLGGRFVPANPRDHQTGIAMGADLRSGAIATSWNPSPTGPPRHSVSFNLTAASLFSAYQSALAASDVVNTSWGFVEPTGGDAKTVGLDGLARAHPRTTFVAAAGNRGPDANSVFGFAAGYNAIAVANLGNPNAFDAPNAASSRGPQDYSDPVRGLVPAARAVVDIAAPGTNITTAYYGGQTGGNSPVLGGSPGGSAGSTSSYDTFTGTSFAAPMVAGAAALLDSASYRTPALAANPNSRDARVIKAVLLNAAAKTSGWDNGQSLVGGVVTTDRALDYAVGAGRLDIGAAYGQYLSGTTDLPGTGTNEAAAVGPVGWDFGAVAPATFNDYVIADALPGGSTLTATLAWFRDRTFTDATSVSDDAFRDLDLEVWDATFSSLIAQSRTRFDNVEHLYVTLPETGQYGLRVRYFDTPFGAPADEAYAVAWSLTPVPEPSVAGVVALALLTTLTRHRRGGPAGFTSSITGRPLVGRAPGTATWAGHGT